MATDKLGVFDAIAKTLPVAEQQKAAQEKSKQVLAAQSQIQQAEPGDQDLLPRVQLQTLQTTPSTLTEQMRSLSDLSMAEDRAASADRLSRQEMSNMAQLDSKQQRLAKKIQDKTFASKRQVMKDDAIRTLKLEQLGFEVDNNLQLATLKQRQDLAKLGNDVKSKILDDRITFEKDEAGRKFSNERQLADYMLANAKSSQEFATNIAKLEQMYNVKSAIDKMAHNRVLQIIERGWIAKEGDLDAAHKTQLVTLAGEIKKKIARDQAKAQGRMAMYQGVGTIVGATVGAVATGGSPVGAVVGAQIGGSLGTMTASQT